MSTLRAVGTAEKAPLIDPITVNAAARAPRGIFLLRYALAARPRASRPTRPA